MDKCREEFEKYCKSKWFINLETNKEYDYIALQTRVKFDVWRSAWKASRESMKAIKLPDTSCFESIEESWDGENETTHEVFYKNDYKEAVIDAITSAGYKVEE